MTAPRSHSPLTVAVSGLAALAVAMGIGRFAFTPVLPMMQADHGISMAQGGWLASANYLGYLAGSLFAMYPIIPTSTAIRVGLVLIAACTLAMGVDHHFTAWLILRAIPGFASALVLVAVSSWILPRLVHAERGDLSGKVFAGVGTGIMFAGVACLVMVRTGVSSDTAWIVLGMTAVGVTFAIWRALGDESTSGSERAAAYPPRDTVSNWRLVFCYGAFGLGYIIPATFLPVMAKQVIADAGWFAWVWPIFGAAATISTVLATPLALRFGDRNVWITSNVTMAVGILVPIALPNLTGIAIAALCVGGTFMVITMTGIQEARRVAGVHARVLIGAMTSAFAVGQIIGPLLVASLVHLPGGFSWALSASALPLLVAAYVLYMQNTPAAQD
jgi:predicted MFS family arabinose efflux permease